jgi:hypothetical protein
MLLLAPEQAESELIAWVRDWLDLLAAGRLEEACARLDGPAGDGMRWTPERLRTAVDESFGPGTRFRTIHPEGPVFTSVGAARGRPDASLIAFADGSGYSVEHDVPLNGTHSDLTAQFEFRWLGRSLAVSLYDLHVL